MSDNFCDYGCGRPAVHTFKNGKKCCSKFTTQCPEMSKKSYAGLVRRRTQVREQFNWFCSGYFILSREDG